MPTISTSAVQKVIDAALREDDVDNDVTTRAAIGDHSVPTRASLVAKDCGKIAGIGVAAQTFQTLDAEVAFDARLRDGNAVEPGSVIATVAGEAQPILTAERTALNLVQRMSGIATLTAKFVAEVGETSATIVDTRKTVPGLRIIDKYSVVVGGGKNHRMSLSDGILIKDNHIAACAVIGMSLPDVISQARRDAPFALKIEVEADTYEQAIAAIEAGSDIVLLDNMEPETIRAVLRHRTSTVQFEASGGITLQNVRSIAEAGVDFISIGQLTHSVTALDISLDFDFE